MKKRKRPLSERRERARRGSLRECLLAGGGMSPIGEFEGIVYSLEYGKVLLGEISVRFKDAQGQYSKGYEDHIWMTESSAFKKAGAEEGLIVRFNAYVTKYRRMDGQANYGLCRPSNIVVRKPSF